MISVLDKFLIAGFGFNIGVFWVMSVNSRFKKQELISMVLCVIGLGILFLC